MRIYETKTCANCGAGNGLHNFDTHQCPKNGREETRDHVPQEWADTTFEDSGIMKVKDAAIDLLEALEEIVPFAKEFINDNHPTMKKAKEAIKKATI